MARVHLQDLNLESLLFSFQNAAKAEGMDSWVIIIIIIIIIIFIFTFSYRDKFSFDKAEFVGGRKVWTLFFLKASTVVYEFHISHVIPESMWVIFEERFYRKKARKKDRLKILSLLVSEFWTVKLYQSCIISAITIS